MTSKVGNYDVHSTGSILVEIGKPIEIFFGGENDLKFIMNLINDPGKANYTSTARLINPKTIEIDLFNFVNSGISQGGSKYPVKIGTLGNRALYYSFLVVSIGNGVQPVFTYTF